MELLSCLESIVHFDDEGEVHTLENTSLSHGVLVLLLSDDLFFLQNFKCVMDLRVFLLDKVHLAVRALTDDLKENKVVDGDVTSDSNLVSTDLLVLFELSFRVYSLLLGRHRGILFHHSD